MILDDKKKKLTVKQITVADSNFDEELIKETYNVSDDESVEAIKEDLKKNSYVKDYMYTKAQVETVELELYTNATLDDPEGKSSVKQKAIDSFLDRTKGKAQTKVDVTSGGEKILGNVINFIDGES